MSNEQQSGKMWSGRFREPLDKEFEQWQRSIVFDWRLLAQEIAASKAHASALAAAGVMTSVELERNCARRWITLRRSLAQTKARALVRNHPVAEDIHHFVELSLVERVGSLGLKLHTGRSRNEQIATDLRLYVRGQIELVIEALAKWAEALVEKAQNAGDAVMPSYTHLQRAEPVLVAHWMLAYVEMILRDADAVEGLLGAIELLSAGIGSSGRSNTGAGSDDCGAGVGIHCADREFDGCDERSGFHSRISAGADVCGIAFEPVCGGDHAVCHGGVRICECCRRHSPPDRARCRRRRILT